MIPFYNKKLQFGDLISCLFIWKSREKLLELLKKSFNNENILITKSGRQGIKLILDTLGLRKNEEVIVPSFICSVVVEAIERAGEKAVFAEVENQGFNLDIEEVRRKITPKTRAIILPYIFGIPSKTKEFVDLCRENNLVLIEDCAHSLEARYQNQTTGTFGDFAVFSFGFSKSIGGIGGGFILTKDKEALEKIKEKNSKNKKPSFSLKQFLEVIFIPVVFNKYLYFLFSRFVEMYGEFKRGKENEKEFSFQPSNLEIKIALQKLKKYEKIKEERNKSALIYKQEFNGLFSFPVAPAESQSAYLSFPVFASNEIFLLLKKNKIPVQRVEFGRPGGKFPENYFLLPLDYSTREIKKICTLIKNILNKKV